MENQFFNNLQNQNYEIGVDVKATKRRRSTVLGATLMWLGYYLIIAIATGALIGRFASQNVLINLYSYRTPFSIGLNVGFIILLFVGSIFLTKSFIKTNKVATLLWATGLMVIVGIVVVAPITFILLEANISEFLIVTLVPLGLMIIAAIFAAYEIIKLKFAYTMLIALFLTTLIISLVSIFAFHKPLMIVWSLLSILLGFIYLYIDWVYVMRSNQFFKDAIMSDQTKKEITVAGMFFGFKIAFDLFYLLYQLAILVLRNK
ncbi:MAG0110 family membrane protein [Mycoplasmopsis columbinasalis]|uniref:Inhibitor of apoptosis-promoting Bax1 n=1 Tax=Mycoplasmopsis columbinasalis TaxID=114880 RepID=A0A449BAB6_9BACT|nr:hypothetical protein [Mycoplasmopsis columbinasalis]VEU78132.1 Uncharacterised protein [Mycoplasmopsis columbinasalis]